MCNVQGNDIAPELLADIQHYINIRFNSLTKNPLRGDF